MPIDQHAQPRLLWVPGRPPLPLFDIRHRYPVLNVQRRSLSAITQVIQHHDGVLFAPGDRDYDGTTVDEDLARLDAIYNRAIAKGWGRFPYHGVISPNFDPVTQRAVRAYYTLDSGLVGTHLSGANTKSQGLAVMGDYTTRRPTDQVVFGAAGFIAATYRGLLRKPPIFGHRDKFATTCPGDTWNQWRDMLLAVANAFTGF